MYNAPDEHGWKINLKNQYEIDFFAGLQYPELGESINEKLPPKPKRNEILDDDTENSFSDDESEYVSIITTDETDDDYDTDDPSIFE